MGPHACEPRQQNTEYWAEFHLCACVGRACALGEYVEDESGAVKHLNLQLFFDVGLPVSTTGRRRRSPSLCRCPRCIGVSLRACLIRRRCGVRAVHLLCELAHCDGSGRVGQKFQFVEIFLGACLVLGAGVIRPTSMARSGASVAVGRSFMRGCLFVRCQKLINNSVILCGKHA